MTTPRDPDRLIQAFINDGPEQMQDQVYDAVRAGIEQKRQRVVIGPWRMPTMNKLVPIGLGAAAVVVALVIGSRLLAPAGSSGLGAGPTASPSASPSPSPTPSPSASPAASPPPLSQTFTSQMHGISMSYPEGWVARAATEPWTDTGEPQYLHPGYDVLYDPVHDNHFLDITSQPIGNSTPEEWVAAKMAGWGCSTTEPIAVDGATGLIAANCRGEFAFVTTAGRGYGIQLYTPYSGEGEVPPADFAYDRAWFEEVLATVQIQPADAVDVAPSASP